MQQGERLQSLDVFRGITMAVMLVVNHPGAGGQLPWPLEHAAWDGWTIADLIFPWFLFIVGISIVLSQSRAREAGASTALLLRRVALRAALLFLFGMFLNFLERPDLSVVRIPGILQRIAVVYGVTAALWLTVSERALWGITALILVGYWAALLLIPVPGEGRGILGPNGNLPQYVDVHLFGAHIWRTGWDPEGLLSTIPAIASGLVGTFAGSWMRSNRPAADRALGLFLWGVAAVVIGRAWSVVLPINKNLWSSSFVIFTTGFGLIALGWLYWLIDMKKVRWGTWPFLVFGTNALFAYLFSEALEDLLAKWPVMPGSLSVTAWTSRHLFVSWMGPTAGSLGFAVTFTALCLVPLGIMYHKRWLLRV
jgi:predicted acyltransferase